MVQGNLSIRENYKLYSIVIELGAAKSGNPPPTLGRAIHSQVLQWIQLGNAELAEEVHNAFQPPITLSGLQGNRRKIRNQLKNLEGDNFYFRITILQDNLLKPLLKGIELWGEKRLILGHFSFVLRQYFVLPQTHPLVSSTDFDSLVYNSPVTSTIQLNFFSPTSFKQEKYIQVFLHPELVFNSLLRKWNYFAPESLHFTTIEWDGFVSAFELKTHALRLEGGAEIGSQGWVKYHFLDSEQMRIASILAQFAFYAGVGRKTTMGMGQTRSSLVSNETWKL